MYRCMNCGKQIESLGDKRVKCPYCGFRILLKNRGAVMKEVSA